MSSRRQAEAKKSQPLAALIDAHHGRAAVVIGGGISAPAQLARAPEGALFLSANQHGCMLRACDYIVALDVWEHREFKLLDGRMVKITHFGVPIISPRPGDADYRIFDKPAANSGAVAAWCAWVMGCAPILLAGIDCYEGGTYYHDHNARSSGNHVPVDQHLRKWAKAAAAAPGAMIRSLGGPLEALFPPYDPAEPVTYPETRASVPGASGIPVRTRRVWSMAHGCFPEGAELDLSEGEFRRAIRERAVEKRA